MMDNNIKKKIIKDALKTNARICLPETNDKRIFEAKKELLALGFNIVDCSKLKGNISEYKELVKKKKFSRNWTEDMINKYLDVDLNLSVLALDNDDLDCVIAGACHKTSEILRTAIRIVGVHRNKKWVTSVFFMFSPCQKYLYTYGDCAVIPEPSSEQLCYIGYESSQIHQLISGNKSKVAFLSFSTKGSAEHYKVKRVQDAVSLFSKKYNNIQFDGELQFDAAVDINVSSKKIDNSSLEGKANVFVFPDLDSGNISYKITQSLANYQAIGPILIGLKKTVNDLSRGCTVDDIVYTAAISALQS